MKILSVFLMLFVVGCSSVKKEVSQTTILLVRHAEKQKGKNPSLTKTGAKRAKSLVAIAQPFKISGIYSTNYKRTMETATPLAQNLSIKINNSISPMDYSGLLKDIKKNYLGKAVLVVGHSNTTPEFINFMDPQQKLPMIGEKDYSNLYIVELIGNKIVLIKKSY